MSSSNQQPQPKRGRVKCKQVGNYILEKTLGEGTFGKVKLGTFVPTGDKVAVKILEKQKIADVSDVERVTREIHILKLIRHPNIIQLYEIIETPRQLYLIMEFADGGELFDYIVKKTRVPEIEACRFFQQLIAGIDYIRRLGVVHRDLKPENLLLDHNKNIKIVDFGLSNTFRPEELLKTACGSPCYAAPEMIAGKNYVPYKVDIWSCGVILFALICGYLPFEDPDTSKLYKKILKGNYECPNFISSSARDLIAKILNTDPEQRFTVEQIQQHPWCNQVTQQIPHGIMIGYDIIPVDEEILYKLQDYNFDTQSARKWVEANKHNYLTTAYYLLLKNHIRGGGVSIADISVDYIDPKLLTPKTPVVLNFNNSPHPELPRFSVDVYFKEDRRKGRRRPGSSLPYQRVNMSYDPNQNARGKEKHQKRNTVNFSASSRYASPSRRSVQRRSASRSNSRHRSDSLRHKPSSRENIKSSEVKKRRSQQIRLSRGFVSVTTAKPPMILMNAIFKSLTHNKITYKLSEDGRIKAQCDGIKFSIEVNNHERLDGLYCLNFKRIAGDLWEYKDVCAKLLGSISL